LAVDTWVCGGNIIAISAHIVGCGVGGEMIKSEEILVEILQPMKWPEFERDRLMQRAKQIPRVLTNPGSYQPKELDYPLIGEFVD
jgi:hypothetical protein